MAENRFVFKVLVYPSDDQYEAQIPLLGAKTFGVDMMDAIYMAQDLMETIVSYRIESDLDIPQESITSDVRKDMPDGGCVVVLFTDGRVPETEEMTVQDAADILGVSTSRVYAMCKDGVLDSRRLGNAVMVSTKSVKERQNAEVRPGRPKEKLTAV
jgi:excisionase family DNA binding protein